MMQDLTDAWATWSQFLTTHHLFAISQTACYFEIKIPITTAFQLHKCAFVHAMMLKGQVTQSV